MRSDKRETFYRYILGEKWTGIHYWQDEEPNVDFNALTVDDIANGWQSLLKMETAGKFRHCLTYNRTVRDSERALVDIDHYGEEDYDACIIDAVVQLATLGEIRYG